MYKLSQWAGDFPNALGATRELHASVHEPTRGSSLFKSVSLRLHISASCPVFLLPIPPPRASFIPSLLPPLNLQISRNCRSQLVLLAVRTCRRVDGRMDGRADARTGAQPLLVNQALRTIVIDRVRLQTDVRRRGSDADEKGPPDNTLRFLRLAALSEAPCLSFPPFDSHLL